jgi:NADPH-dependent 2,4-dienoyl-CoA reductase/sulfur reductase-like enzyme
MRSEKLVVIGGDAAGMSAASVARRHRPDLEIIVFEQGPFTSYSACGIPYYVGGMVPDHLSLIARTPETFREKQHIRVRTGHRVTGIDPRNRRVTAINLESRRELTESYEQLLIATGSRAMDLEVPGRQAARIFPIKTLEGAVELRRTLDAGQIRRAVVVGAGYIGLEMAEAFLRRGLEVAVLEKASQVLVTLDAEMANQVAEALEGEGVRFFFEEPPVAFEMAAGAVQAVVTPNRTLPTDLVVFGMGVRPASELAAAAGIELGVQGAIRTDRRMTTGIAGIWAAGDCAESPHLLTGQPSYFPLGTVANRHGRVAGVNIAGGHAEFPGSLGTSVTKACGMEVGQTGLLESELQKMAIPYASEKISSHTRSGYYPGSDPITIKLLASLENGRLLGGQIVGGRGAGKRIDVIATALQAGLTAEQVSELDLSYAPPFSPVWDPVLIAARQLARLIG